MSASVPPFTRRQSCWRAELVGDNGPTRRTGLKSVAGIGGLGATAVILAMDQRSAQTQRASSPARELRPAASFAGITNRRARSIALFEEMSKVLRHPRCMNCHPASDRPTQTDAMRPHQPLVVRGIDGHGAPGLPCATCHHAANFDPAGIPGHPDWHLAPASMAWQGPSAAPIYDRTRNGNPDLLALIRHLSDDSLVGCAWSPGGRRTPPPRTPS